MWNELQYKQLIYLSLSTAGGKRLTDLNTTLNGLTKQTGEHILASQHEIVHSSLELLQQALLTLDSEASAHEEPEQGGSAACTYD
ncbi:hypothetical protein KDA_52030 [Dictyobacter alpinus]|uniref:Uncharacterized protein n=2 Tax=Dictyobacter alpinus TaxID=2014873 RepID=A0A402BEG8_9CHLR|nr:hypothetical protein KDA_52030 [Dictyobacter alpinus]